MDLEGECQYSNLLYACATCNESKRAILGLPDPCKVAFNDCLRVTADGHVDALNAQGEKLKQVLRLDSEKSVRHRSRWIKILGALKANNPDLYKECMGFPEDLPDLRNLRVPENTRPDEVANCYFALRERGELPATY